MKTSGLFLSYNEDGSVILGYEDYGVDIFDGYDYEVNYRLDKSNFKLLCKCLNLTANERVEDLLIKKFGYNFDSIAFETFCKQHKIVYARYIHIG
ncbi:MAG: hypothetical protein QM204_06625 [Bacillota bacterium]|jgi:hypothetical protein|nr:hypothetical protein [Bacillota bacterium]NLL26335.1 hypothetical protein [Erysipelotrichia bacterium]